MVVKTRTRELTRNIPFAENDTGIMELPQDNLIRRLILEFDFDTSTPSGDTAGTGVKNNALTNLVKRIQVRLNGTDSVFDVDLTTYVELLDYEYGTKPTVPTYTIPAAAADSDFKVFVPIDFSLVRNQLSDYSALLPANLLGSLDLLITWGSAADLLSTVNDTQVDSTTKCKVHVVEVYETTSDRSDIEAIISNLTKVYEGVEQTVIDKQYDSYPSDELSIDIQPVPARHLSHMMVAYGNITDKNPTTNTNAPITTIKVENVQGGGEAILLGDFIALSGMSSLDYLSGGALKKGHVYLNWADLRNGGLDNISVDALKYKLLTGTPTASKENAARIYKKYIPVQV